MFAIYTKLLELHLCAYKNMAILQVKRVMFSKRVLLLYPLIHAESWKVNVSGS